MLVIIDLIIFPVPTRNTQINKLLSQSVRDPWCQAANWNGCERCAQIIFLSAEFASALPKSGLFVFRVHGEESCGHLLAPRIAKTSHMMHYWCGSRNRCIILRVVDERFLNAEFRRMAETMGWHALVLRCDGRNYLWSTRHLQKYIRNQRVHLAARRCVRADAKSARTGPALDAIAQHLLGKLKRLTL
jgi:hypothetical protein